MKMHELKTWPEYFTAVIEGRKPFEIRKNDRDFKVNDVIVLREWKPGRGYTGRQAVRRITYMCDGSVLPEPPMVAGYFVLGLEEVADTVTLCARCGAECRFGLRWCERCANVEADEKQRLVEGLNRTLDEQQETIVALRARASLREVAKDLGAEHMLIDEVDDVVTGKTKMTAVEWRDASGDVKIRVEVHRGP